MNPELRHVRSFVVLAQELNFTRAAARLHLAQQALSKQIRQLEDMLGTPLFVRTTRKVELTAAGRALYQEAGTLLKSADELFDSVREMAKRNPERLTLGTLSTAGMPVTTEVLRSFGRERPDVRVVIRNYGLGADRSAGVRRGETDVSIVLLPFESGGLAIEGLYHDPRVALLAASHPLAGRRELRAAELAGEPWIMAVGRDPVATDYWTLAAYRDGPARVGAEINDPDEYYAAIRAGQAIAAPTASMTQAYGWTDLVIRPIVDLPPAEVAICWRREVPNHVRDEFIQVARAVARRAPIAAGL